MHRIPPRLESRANPTPDEPGATGDQYIRHFTLPDMRYPDKPAIADSNAR